MSCLNGFGLSSLMDAADSFFGSGLPVWYRTKNFIEAAVGEAVNEMGFQITASVYGGASGGIFVPGLPGTNDTQICPTPASKQLTMKYIADAQAAGTALRAGAKLFNVSAIWVAQMQSSLGLSHPRLVWNNDQFVGLYHDGVLWAVESYVHNDLFGAIISWDLYCNANDQK